MTINLDKPFYNYEQQIQRLKYKNIQIENKDKAYEILSCVSYFTLINSYKNSHLYKDNKFVTGVSLEILKDLYYFDLELQGILFKYLTIIEASLKTKLSYEISKKFGVYTPIENRNESIDLTTSYLNRKLYSSTNSNRNKILGKLRKHIQSSYENPLKLYKYGDKEKGISAKNHIPPWVLVKNIYFKDAIDWYSILPANGEDLKLNIIKQFYNKNYFNNEDLKNFFISSLKILNQYRNAIAHNNKSINIKLTRELDIRLVEKFTNDKYVFNSSDIKHMKESIFPILFIIITLLPIEYLRAKMIVELEQIFKKLKKQSNDLYNITLLVANLQPDFLDKLAKLVINIHRDKVNK
ncbi:Abi family protein [Gemella sp. GH3]|uniref:Abi family protein n=1 Tax=unclassified Gemella TaxID=2624949 RepID=UPI0015CFDF4D|nr:MULTISPECIES: Abi family protein [unclassified Gemella]MBF0714541.1 Abi family protein [Gemella sp. GH3.1]NYS51493.1 Abi family protein [Gemella sp. GH3]